MNLIWGEEETAKGECQTTMKWSDVSIVRHGWAVSETRGDWEFRLWSSNSRNTPTEQRALSCPANSKTVRQVRPSQGWTVKYENI